MIVSKTLKKANKRASKSLKAKKKAKKKPVIKRVKSKTSTKRTPKVRTTTTRTRIRKLSFIEILFASGLKKAGIAYKPQFKVKRKTRVRGSFYLDFALPEKKIGIECDGYQYHHTEAQLRRDARRQRELEDMGWKIIRFTGSQICRDITACVKVLKAHL